MKPIRFSGHARDQMRYRGVTEQEVIETIRAGPWQPTELGRLECRKNFPFEGQWNQRSYTTKQVRPIFVDEPDEIVVVTVYSYYS